MRKILTIALTTLALALFAVPGALAAEQPVDFEPTEALMTPVQDAQSAVENAEQEPLFVQDAPVEQCGNRVCPPGTYCCNASCGICLEPGLGCIQIVCDNPGDIRN